MDCTAIAELKPGIRGITIRCRVARIWDCSNSNMDNQLISVDFLLVDELGDAIQATIRPRESQWLRDTINEGDVYLCSGFIVVANENNYRTCGNPDIICVSRGTTKFDCCSDKVPSTFPSNHFDFVSYDRLADRADKKEYLSDVIGQLTSMGPIEYAYARGNPVEKRNLKLQNTNGNTISATLWTTIAQQINDLHVHELMEHECVIVILAAVAVTTFQGTTSLSSKSATKVYLNLPNSATSDFRLELKTPTSCTFNAAAPTREAQMMRNRKKLEELLHLNRKTPREMRFTCTATIKDVNPFNGWWFPSCPKCSKKVKTAGAIHYCNNCSIYIDDTPDFRYMLELVVEDDTADCVFMIIGEHAEYLIGQTAADLATDNTDRFILPHAIKQLKGKSRIFEVAMMQTYATNKSNHNGHLSFKVTRSFEEARASTDSFQANKKRAEATASTTKQTDHQYSKKQKTKTVPASCTSNQTLTSDE